MAGLGRKVFTRETLTSADVNGYLMDQAVMRFASASARSAAIPSPAEGMHTYLDDTDRTEIYVGGTWRQVPFLTRGGAAGVTDGAGTFTFNHNVGATPQSVQLTPYSSAVQHVAKLVVTAVSGTQVQVAMYNSSNGAAMAGNPIAFAWVCFL